MFRRKSENRQEVVLTITNQTFVRVVLLILGTVVLLAALHRATHALIIIFTAFFLALALNGPVHWVAVHLPGKKRGSRALATALSFLLVVVVLGIFIASLVPPLVRQTENFINVVPGLVNDVENQQGDVGKFIRRYNLGGQVKNLSSQLQQRLKSAGGTALSTTAHIGTSIFTILTVLALTFMMLVEGPHWLQFIKELFPRRRQDDVQRIALDMYAVVKGYVNGQVILALIASAFILPALFILHISYPVALVVIVFICGLIPMVGHTIGAVIVTTIALFHSPVTAIIILAYYILYQQIENYLIQPRVQANSTNLSPLLVFSAVVIGVSFSGLLGGLVAIPLMGCVRILGLEYLRERRSLEHSPTIREELHEAEPTNDTK